jgi:hypothetical protein
MTGKMTDSYSPNDVDDLRALLAEAEAKAEALRGRSRAQVEAMLDDLSQEIGYPVFYAWAVDNTDFDEVDRVHNWRNYIPDAFKRRWNELSYETRIVAYVIAEIVAHREEWD